MRTGPTTSCTTFRPSHPAARARAASAIRRASVRATKPRCQPYSKHPQPPPGEHRFNDNSLAVSAQLQTPRCGSRRFFSSFAIARLALRANPQDKRQVHRLRISVKRDIARATARDHEFTKFGVDFASDQRMGLERLDGRPQLGENSGRIFPFVQKQEISDTFEIASAALE